MPLKTDFLHNKAQKVLEPGNHSRIRWLFCSLLLKWDAMPIRVSERSIGHQISQKALLTLGAIIPPEEALFVK